MEIIFNINFIVGFTVAVIFGKILERMSKANNTIKQRNKPLDTLPDAIQPKTTPAGVVRKSNLARLEWLFWLYVLLGFVVLIIAAASQ